AADQRADAERLAERRADRQQADGADEHSPRQPTEPQSFTEHEYRLQRRNCFELSTSPAARGRFSFPPPVRAGPWVAGRGYARRSAMARATSAVPAEPPRSGVSTRPSAATASSASITSRAASV